MRNVLADLCVESEAATLTALRLARAYDRGETAFARRRDGGREVLGLQARPRPRRRGARVPRRQRLRRGVGAAAHSTAQQPLQSIWEGSGNVICLDVLRALRRKPETRRGVPRRVPRGARRRRRASTHGSTRLERELRDPDDLEAEPAASSSGWASRSRPRCSCGYGDAAVADAFCASRLAGEGGLAYGTLPAGLDAAAIVERHRPRI